MSSSSDDDDDVYQNEHLITDDEDDVLPSEDEEDSDLDDVDERRFNRFEIEHKKDEMASDIEDDNEEDYLPNSQAWGKNKKLFYDTDYVDKDFRSQKQKDEDLAKYEEEEALNIQKRLIESVNEDDLGIDFFIDTTKSSDVAKTNSAVFEQNISEKIEFDLSTLEDSRKLDILKKEAPDLLNLVSDLKKYLFELENKLKPTLKYLLDQNALSTSGLKYLKLRCSLLINYCTNISFYLALMSSQDKQNVKEHPIIKEIYKHKKLIAELDSYSNTQGKSFLEEFELAFKSYRQSIPISFINTQIDNKNESILATKVTSQRQHDEIQKFMDDSLDESQESVLDEDDVNEEDDDAKRAITYEMEKNKGLIAKRKREQRNPRVKYRKKFEKAIIRRKGQVREPRKEMKKYGGELTGINAHSVKSIKFK